jgi:hypothetical protein
MKNDSGLSGLLGDVISVRKVRGRVIITARKRSVSKPTAKLVAVRERFKEAAQYAIQQMSDETIRDLYKTRITAHRHTPYLVALSDYLNAPKVNSIDVTGYSGVAGNSIYIRATDDFMVTKVCITIMGVNGSIIEKGDAVHDTTTNQWEYSVTVASPSIAGTTIRAVAFDRPGNTGMAEVTVQA